MTLHHLDVAASDVSAGELGYRVDTHPVPGAPAEPATVATPGASAAPPAQTGAPTATTDTGATVLASSVIEHPDGHGALRLSILGASHAVTLLSGGRDVLTEEVSCRAAASGGGPLPESAVCEGPWGTHRVGGSTETLDPGAFRALVVELTSLADADEAVLAGRFPGADGSLTVVVATPDPSGWSWRTWHLYPAVSEGATTGTAGTGSAAPAPAGGDVVHTTTRLDLVRDAELVGVAP